MTYRSFISLDPSWCFGCCTVEQFDLDGSDINPVAFASLASCETAEHTCQTECIGHFANHHPIWCWSLHESVHAWTGRCHDVLDGIMLEYDQMTKSELCRQHASRMSTRYCLEVTEWYCRVEARTDACSGPTQTLTEMTVTHARAV